MASLPAFRYLDDPLASGSVIASDNTCLSGERASGFISAGPVFTEEELVDEICPWCIADGSAAEKSDAVFTDAWGTAAGVPAAVVDEVTRRTPGCCGWRQERWLDHGNDARAFVGHADAGELRSHPDARDMVLHHHDQYGWSPDRSEAQVDALSKTVSPTAYLFRCLHCGAHLAYSDFD